MNKKCKLDLLPLWADVEGVVKAFEQRPHTLAKQIGLSGDTVARFYRNPPTRIGYETVRRVLRAVYRPERDIEMLRYLRVVYAKNQCDVASAAKSLGVDPDWFREALASKEADCDPRHTTLRRVLDALPPWVEIADYARSVAAEYSYTALAFAMRFSSDSQIFMMLSRNQPRYAAVARLVEVLQDFPVSGWEFDAEVVTQRLRELVQRKGLRPTARRLGVSHSWLHRILNGEIRRPYVWQLKKVAKRMGLALYGYIVS